MSHCGTFPSLQEVNRVILRDGRTDGRTDHKWILYRPTRDEPKNNTHQPVVLSMQVQLFDKYLKTPLTLYAAH